MAARHQPHADGNVAQVGQARQLGVRAREERVAGDAVEVGHELAHPRARVADRPPLAGRVGDFLGLQERRVLRPLEVAVGTVAGDLVHDLVEDHRLKALGLEMPLFERHPLVQAHEVRHDFDRL